MNESDTRLALVAVCATTDASLLGEDGCDEEIQGLFARGILATRRDYCDEYFTVLTDEGRAFVREQLGIGVAS